MNLPKQMLTAIVIILGLWGEGSAQSLHIKSIEFLNNKVVVHYDILDSLEGREFTVRMYSSSDGFLNPLEDLTGDIGLEVKSGKNKTISWAALEELPNDFSGKISLEVRARLFIPFIQTESINQYKIFKRKRQYNLTWAGGSPQNILNFDLYRGEKKIASFPNLANVGHHAFEFGSGVKPGKNYKFRISDAKNKDEVVFTEPFKIKRKVPLLAKVIPAGLIGYAAFMLFSPSDPAADDDIVALSTSNLPKN